MRRVHVVLAVLIVVAVGVIAVGTVVVATGWPTPVKEAPTEEKLEEWFGNLTPPGYAWASRESSDLVLQAVFKLIDHPKEAVPFLRKKLKPVDGPEPKAIDGWVKEYLGDDAKARDAAEAELRKHREDYLVVQKLLQAGQVTESQPLRRRAIAVIRDEPVKEPKDGEYVPDVNFDVPAAGPFYRGADRQFRLELVRADQVSPHRENHHRTQRALLVLERIGTPEAVEALKEVAAGREGLPATTAAKEALARLKAK